MLDEDFSLKRVHVYLKTTPERCLEGIGARARPGEENIDLEFLRRFDVLCQEYYNQLIKDNERVLIINVEELCEKNTNRIDVDEIIHKIFVFLNVF